MSRIKIALVALTLLVSGFAYAGDKKSETKTAGTAKTGDVLYWFNPAVSAYQYTNTAEDEQVRTGCNGTAAICEKGYSQDQLNDPNDPSQGVQSGEQGSPATIIRQVN